MENSNIFDKLLNTLVLTILTANMYHFEQIISKLTNNESLEI